MKLNFVTERLLNRYKENKLAHLYIIRANVQSEAFNSFYQNIIYGITKKELHAHPDFLVIDLDEGEKYYKVDSPNFQNLLRFLNYAPVNIGHKFIFINHAHLISDILANKLLKTFEELNEKTTIFLYCPGHEAILDTIKSRSIEIYIDIEKQELKNQPGNFSELFNQFKQEQVSEKEFVETVILNSNHNNYEDLDKLLVKIKKYNQGLIFNNSKSNNAHLLMP